MSAVSLAATETLINRTGKTVTGIKVTFFKQVLITRHDAVFPDIDPSRRSDTFTFSGGNLRNLGRFSISWLPSSAKVKDHKWIEETSIPQEQGLSVPDIQTDTFQVNVGSTSDGATANAEIQREILREQLPFTVRYKVSLPVSAASCSLYWDVDEYVDSDDDGNTTNDHDKEGTAIELTYVENYNPTVTLHIVDETGAEVATWENMVRNDFHVGETINIDGVKCLALQGIKSDGVAQTSWTQRHMGKMSFEYMTEYEGQISNPTALNTNLICKYPGKYVLDLNVVKSDGSTAHLPVVAWVIRTFSHAKAVGFMMADLWNEYYDQQADKMDNVSMFFSDYDAIHKLDYLQNQGFQSVDVADIFPMVNTWPYPEITYAAAEIMYINDQDLGMIFDHIQKGNLNWGTDYFGAGPSHWTDFEHLSRSYYEHFFTQYHDQVLQKAALAEKLGLSSFTFGYNSPYLWGLCSIEEKNRADAIWVRDQWISLCDEVRKVFHGKLGLGVPASCSFTTPITQHVDFIYEIFIDFSGHAAETKWAKSVEDLRVAYSSYLDKYVGALYRLFRVPIRFTFWAYSYRNGSTTGLIPENEQDTYDSWNDEYRWGGYGPDILEGKTNPKYPPDFREQVKMIEAMMPMLAEKDYIQGIVSEFEYWKLLSFTDFTPDNVIDYYQVFTGDLQGKPGFQAYKLWASMLDPNDNLAYRRVISPHQESKIVIGDAKFFRDSKIDWSSVPYVAVAPEGYTPATYWGSNGEEDISKSQHWYFPGHDLKGIKCNFDDSGLAIRWETYKPDIKSGFTFELRFDSSDDSDDAVFIDVSPRDKRAQVQLQTDGTNYYLESSIAAFVIEPSQTILYLKNIDLPNQLGKLQDLHNWRMSAFVLLTSDSGNEYYEFPTNGASSSNSVTLDTSLVFDTSVWPDVPPVFNYPSTPDIGFYCDGDHDLAHAQFWGEPGCKIASVKTALANDALIVRVDLHDDDAFGDYRYIISYNFPDDGRMLVFIDPKKLVGDVAMDADNSWTWIWETSGEYFGFKDRSVYVVVPLDAIKDYVTHDKLRASRIDFHIDYVKGSRRELFLFPSPNTHLQCIDRDVLRRESGDATEKETQQIKTGTVMATQIHGITTFELGLSPHAVIPYKESLLVVDYAGDIYSLDPESGRYKQYVGVASPQLVDGAISGNYLYVSQEDGVVLRFDVSNMSEKRIITNLAAGKNSGMTLAGIEVAGNILYGLLFDEAQVKYFLCTYDLESGDLKEQAPITVPVSLGELITLCSHGSTLYTVDWHNARGYLIVTTGRGNYSLAEPFSIADYVPKNLWAQDPRGFCWSQWGWILATTAYSADTPGKIHIVQGNAGPK